jgi:hypothetical protein
LLLKDIKDRKISYIELKIESEEIKRNLYQDMKMLKTRVDDDKSLMDDDINEFNYVILH